MKNSKRFGLALIIAIILLLALTIPSLAKKPSEPNCYIRPVTVNKSGVLRNDYMYYGTLVPYWDGGILINKCIGSFTYGDSINTGWVIGTFDDFCEFYDFAQCAGGWFTATLSNAYLEIYDPVEKIYIIPDYVIWAINDDSYFFSYKVYTPPE